MTDPPLVQAQNVAKNYRGQPALGGCTLDIRRGEVFGLLGPNGAGKTTMARIVAGFLKPTAGTITVGGVAPWRFRNERGIGFMPEQLPRQGHWSLEHLAMLREYGAGAGAAMRQLIGAFGLAPIAKREIRTYSTGQLRLASAAYVLAGAAPLIILDEPDSGLDLLASEKLTGGIRAANAAGSTIIMLSHNLYHVAEVCDRAAFFFEGDLRDVVDIESTEVLRDQYRAAASLQPALVTA